MCVSGRCSGGGGIKGEGGRGGMFIVMVSLSTYEYICIQR